MALYLHGYDNVAMYDGSWTEWRQDETAPRDDVETMKARSPRGPRPFSDTGNVKMIVE